MEEAPPPGELLPVDVLLEIVARSDVTAVVRCAATCELLRYAILNPGFHCRLRLRAAGANGAAASRFDPALLVGVSYSSSSRGYGDDGIVQLQPYRRLRFDTGLFRSFEPVSSRDGLLVLYRCKPEPELRVCDTFTGHVTTLPRIDDVDGSCRSFGIYRPALVAVDLADRSFELLVMDVFLRTQIFSSKDGRWDAVRAVKPPPERSNAGRIKQLVLHSSPAIIGRTVHWICHGWGEQVVPGDDDLFILALHADAAQATSIEVPEGCLGSSSSSSSRESCNLAATADGRLSVLVAEAEVISMWSLSPEEGWSRQVVIDKRGISRQVAPAVEEANQTVRFAGFGERSGGVLFEMDNVGLVLLNLETKKAILLRGCSERDTRALPYARAWLHEIDLASLLQDMEIFFTEEEEDYICM